GDQQAAAAAFSLDGGDAPARRGGGRRSSVDAVALVHYGTGAFVLWPPAPGMARSAAGRVGPGTSLGLRRGAVQVVARSSVRGASRGEGIALDEREDL